MVFKPIDPFILKTKVQVFTDLYLKTKEVERQSAYQQWLLDEHARVKAEKERAERALRLTEARQQAILKTLPIAIHSRSSEPPFATQFVSEAVQDITGFPPQAFVAEPEFGFGRIHPDDREIVMQRLSAAAQSAFNAVYGQVPGELAPKLALAIACELSGEYDVAEGLYLTCARTDANYIAPSAFGLAEIRTQRHDLDGALAALDLVPRTSGAYVRSRRQRAGLLAGSGRGLPALAQAMDSIDALTIDPVDRANLAADVFRTALAEVQQSGPQQGLRIDGREATEPALRDGLEATYRLLADQAETRPERIALVDQANEVRGWTLR